MANLDSANGFVPYNSPHGGNGQPEIQYLSLSASNSEIGVGSPVTIGAGGVDLASNSVALCGISAEYKAASSGGTIAVWSNPQQLFSAQTDNGTGTLTTAADIRKNCKLVGSGVSNKRSTAEIDEDSGDTTATLQFKVMKLSDEYLGKQANAHGEFNRLVVKINNHQLQGSTGTAGLGT